MTVDDDDGTADSGAGEPSSDQIAAYDEVIRRLKEELQLTQARLRTTREESDAANEELRAERQRIERALRDSEHRLQQTKRLVEISRSPIFIWDFDGGIREWNRGCEELYGYSHDEALGKSKDQLLATAGSGSSVAALREKLMEDGVWTGEQRHTTKSGRELIVDSRIVLETIGGRRLALESTRDVTERREWEKRQRLLLGELAHRVKNTLTVVQAIAAQTLRTHAGEGFLERFSGRLSALAAAHNFLIQSEWKGADLGGLARSQLEAYTMENPDRVRFEGETLLLPADLATPFGLVVHELATNAAKYGALSRPGGGVHISWSLISRNDKRAVRIVWREEGGPPAERPKAGFGTSLIERGIPGATVTNDFTPSGLVCTIEAPLPDGVEHGVAS